MPSFSDSIFLFVLALLLFGPKKLPVLARELGKWVGEFRKASNEFKMQMEEELRVVEQAERSKQIAAMEAAAPATPALSAPEHPHLAAPGEAAASEPTTVDGGTEGFADGVRLPGSGTTEAAVPASAAQTLEPLPIATSGELKIMPPATGLPQERTAQGSSSALGGLLESIPEAQDGRGSDGPALETVLHGD